jgi:hypothetical protein
MLEAQPTMVTERSPARLWRLWLGAGLALAGLALAGTFAFRRGTEEVQSERMKQKVSGLAQDLIRDHWEAMRKAVEQMETDDGAKAFYLANPGLAGRIPSEAAFLEKVRSWRPLLRPLPQALPGLEAHDLSYVRKQDQVELSYRTAQGAFLFMRWSGGNLVELRVY